MASNQGNGRNVGTPDENRPGWRPTEDSGRRRSEDERELAHWEDRSRRDRGEAERSTGYGQGQSGYAAGRYEGDRSWESRYPYADERMRDRGLDPRGYERGYDRGSS